MKSEQMTIHTPGGFEELHEASKMLPRYRIRMLHEAMGKTYKGEHFLESLKFGKKMNTFNSQRLTILHYQLITIKKNRKETTMEEIIAADFFRCLASKEITTLTFIKKRE